MGNFIREKEILYNNKEITLNELSNFREKYNESSIEEQNGLDKVKSKNPKETSTKIEKLKDLTQLLKSDAITQDEFEGLKIEILNPDDSNAHPKLKELNELLKSGSITQDEYKVLKNELLGTEKNQMNTNKKLKVSVDTFAIISFAAGLGGFFILPIIFIPIGYISSIVSYYRIKENDHLVGSGFRIFGAVLTTINILYVLYVYEIGFFSNSGPAFQ